jgi:murein DD-endopeptidase MepM/ murein hydrolase activator NlpD
VASAVHTWPTLDRGVRGERARRRATAVGLIMVCLALGATPVGAQDPGDDTTTDPTTTQPTTSDPTQTDRAAAERAAREIAEARKRANQAAEDYFAAESRLDLLELDRQRLADEYEALVVEVDELRRTLEAVAVDRFVASGSTGIPILTDLREPTEQLHGGVLADVAAQTGATSIDDYEEAQARLSDKGAELDATERDLEAQQEELLQLQADAEDEVEQLREIEAQRLQSEAVRIAVAAQQREEARQLAELERRQAEANRVRRESEVAAAAASTSDDNVSGNRGASGGDVGGRTGGGGPGTNPRFAGDGYIDPTIVCPVQGGSAYGDTWGAPRSGGRRHQGVDMLAPTGTPLQAVFSGWVNQISNALGGVAISLIGDNGNRYYYAHLSRYEGISGYVVQGQVIGYVGDTGNATGVPHLHFEIRPGQGVPVNPYPSVVNAGC